MKRHLRLEEKKRDKQKTQEEGRKTLRKEGRRRQEEETHLSEQNGEEMGGEREKRGREINDWFGEDERGARRLMMEMAILTSLRWSPGATKNGSTSNKSSVFHT